MKMRVMYLQVHTMMKITKMKGNSRIFLFLFIIFLRIIQFLVFCIQENWKVISHYEFLVLKSSINSKRRKERRVGKLVNEAMLFYLQSEISVCCSIFFILYLHLWMESTLIFWDCNFFLNSISCQVIAVLVIPFTFHCIGLLLFRK